MSVSLALIPVALTLRLVMGKNKFESWARSVQVPVPTSFKNKEELIQTVRKAGYDAEPWGGLIKTHIDGERLFFFWEFLDGKWTAVLSKNDSKQMVMAFLDKVNLAAGRQVIVTAVSEQGALHSNNAHTETVVASPVFPTNFRDGELLFRTLKEFGVNPMYRGPDIVTEVENSVLTFRQNGEGPYSVEVQNAPDLKKIFDHLSDVDEDYKRCLQSAVYERLKSKVTERDMTIESEEVLEDNSIVVTINVGE